MIVAGRGTRMLWALIACMASGVAMAVDTTVMPDERLQTRYEALTRELRCMKCQNQSIADSPVGLASDLRRQVQEQLLAGKSDDEVREYMVQRYGDFILFRPRFAVATAWLWIAPFLVLALGLVVGVRVVRQRSRLVADDETPLTPEDAAR